MCPSLVLGDPNGPHFGFLPAPRTGFGDTALDYMDLTGLSDGLTLSIRACTTSAVKESPGTGHSSTLSTGALWHTGTISLLSQTEGGRGEQESHTALLHPHVTVGVERNED